jgi:diguanylate cyclase (GGDEF)-like protein/PAS domain S-box-containing protein
VNAAFSALSGYTEAEAIGRNCRFLQGPGTDPLVSADIRAAVAAGSSICREILNYHKNGTPFWNDLTIDPIRDATGRLTGFIGIQQQADATHLASMQRAEAEARLASVLEHVPGYVYQRVMRTHGTIDFVYCSPSIGKLLGMDAAEATRRFYDLVHPDDRDALIAAIRNSAADMGLFREEFRLVSPNGSTHWLRSDAPPRRMANGEIAWDGLAIEISAEKRWEGEIANRALRDPLTALLSRSAWRQALILQLNAENGTGRGCGLLCIDIKAFRGLNERLGQSAGDEILRETARRLAKIADAVFGAAARLGGDEFAILAPACADRDTLLQIAHSAADALAPPIQTGRGMVIVPYCIGATLDQAQTSESSHDDLASELMTQAELALGWAKQAEKSPILYSRDGDDRFQNQAMLAQSLEHAIVNNELKLYYQPLVDLSSGSIVSAEALVRWNHPTLGIQRPDLFIPMAEKSGLIVQLGRWVVEQTFQQRIQWQDAGLSPPPIAFNVSGIQLLNPDFVGIVEETLKSSRATAGDFEIELTEGMLIEPSPQIMTTLHALRELGFAITIDDFGGGHATFRYLRDFPVDKLKIDQIFVRKLVLGSTDALIIRAVISLARSMGIQFVAEGIETEMQRDFLQSEGCRIGQGYLFSMPLAAEDFAWLLAGDIRLPIQTPAGHQAGDTHDGAGPYVRTDIQ